jgi:dUTP pyrophosphatase
MLIEYASIREGVITPERANPSDCGLDLFFNPADGQDAVIKAGECAVLESGIRVGVPHGYMLEIKNKSSIAAKKSLLVGACVVDPGYDNEILINLHNVGKRSQVIKPGVKIAQAVVVPVIHFRAVESESGDLYNWYPIAFSGRVGGFGSTGE